MTPSSHASLINHLSSLPPDLARLILELVYQHEKQSLTIFGSSRLLDICGLEVVTLLKSGKPTPALLALAREVWFDVNTIRIGRRVPIGSLFTGEFDAAQARRLYGDMYAPHIRRVYLQLDLPWTSGDGTFGEYTQARLLAKINTVITLFTALKDLTISLRAPVFLDGLTGQYLTRAEIQQKRDKLFRNIIGSELVRTVKTLAIARFAVEIRFDKLDRLRPRECCG